MVALRKPSRLTLWSDDGGHARRSCRRIENGRRAGHLVVRAPPPPIGFTSGCSPTGAQHVPALR